MAAETGPAAEPEWDLSDHRGTTGAEASMITGTEICSTTEGWVAKDQVWFLVCVLSF